jgi:hypothetical protein
MRSALDPKTVYKYIAIFILIMVWFRGIVPRYGSHIGVQILSYVFLAIIIAWCLNKS